MVPTVFAIDGFLRNPGDVRAQALSLKYAVGGRYPSLNSVQKLRIEGLQVIPVLVREAAGYASHEDLQKGILDQDALDRSKWEHTMTVPMRFSRLGLLRPHYWHTAGPGFGDSLENGRLIY